MNQHTETDDQHGDEDKDECEDEDEDEQSQRQLLLLDPGLYKLCGLYLLYIYKTKQMPLTGHHDSRLLYLSVFHTLKLRAKPVLCA